MGGAVFSIYRFLLRFVVRRVDQGLANESTTLGRTPTSSMVRSYLVRFGSHGACFQVRSGVSRVFATSHCGRGLSYWSQGLCPSQCPFSEYVRAKAGRLCFLQFRAVTWISTISLVPSLGVAIVYRFSGPLCGFEFRGFRGVCALHFFIILYYLFLAVCYFLLFVGMLCVISYYLWVVCSGGLSRGRASVPGCLCRFYPTVRPIRGVFAIVFTRVLWLHVLFHLCRRTLRSPFLFLLLLSNELCLRILPTSCALRTSNVL